MEEFGCVTLTYGCGRGRVRSDLKAAVPESIGVVGGGCPGEQSVVSPGLS